MKKTAIALIPLLYTAMICPGRKREHPILKVKHFAHRGFHGEAATPDNFMRGLSVARGLGDGG